MFARHEGRAGNNAVYALDLRKLDPWSDSLGAALVQPRVPASRTLNGLSLIAMNYYVTVNGVALRPGEGCYQGVFDDY